MLTPERIEEIRKRLSECAPGPWKACEQKEMFDNWPIGYFVTGEDHDGKKWAVSTDCLRCSEMASGGPEEDAKFIAHARTDIPDLLDHVTDLQAKADALQAEVDSWRELGNQYLAAKDTLESIPDGEAGDIEIGRRAEEASACHDEMDDAIESMRILLDGDDPTPPTEG